MDAKEREQPPPDVPRFPPLSGKKPWVVGTRDGPPPLAGAHANPLLDPGDGVPPRAPSPPSFWATPGVTGWANERGRRHLRRPDGRQRPRTACPNALGATWRAPVVASGRGQPVPTRSAPPGAPRWSPAAADSLSQRAQRHLARPGGRERPRTACPNALGATWRAPQYISPKLPNNGTQHVVPLRLAVGLLGLLCFVQRHLRKLQRDAQLDRHAITGAARVPATAPRAPRGPRPGARSSCPSRTRS